MGLIGSVLDLLLVVLGFGLLIFVHELGHFLAAKWAGIRVLAFAMGFGGALVSYRQGLGWRRGSSQGEYDRVLRAQRAEGTAASPTLARGISPTEYRLNWLPFGGYVKMHGQVDGDPTQVGDEPDSYQKTPVWKRMVVISAGVVANLITAGLLFMLVFKLGLKTEPATVGFVAAGMPASRAALVSGADAGGQAGLAAGDRVLDVQGRTPTSFNDVVMAVAMTPRGQPVRMRVDRPGVGELEFELRPEQGQQTRLMEIGIAPPNSARLMEARTAAEREAFAAIVAAAGAPGGEPGMTLVRADGVETVRGASAVAEAARRSGGVPFTLEFRGEDGKSVRATLTPRAVLESGLVRMAGETTTPIAHLLGLTPVLSVAPAGDASVDRQGLQDGDIFARVGVVEYPSLAEGIREIRRHRGKPIEVVVLRRQADGSRAALRLDPPPTVRREGEGRIGFAPEDSRDAGTWVALPPTLVRVEKGSPVAAGPTAAERVITMPGARIAAVDGVAVESFTALREALKNSTRAALEAGAEARVTLSIVPPISGGAGAAEAIEAAWTLSPAELRQLHGLGWSSPLGEGLFEPEQVLLKAAGPVDAVRMGLHETHRVMVMTYLTFARLFDGTVKVEHLKGPVGIAHIGTRVVERGMVWLLFFMALISVNLAVINFLPLPVVDGGQFIFLCIEALRGRPPPMAVQNAATLVGLVLIGTMFVIVTFNDIVNLFG